MKVAKDKDVEVVSRRLKCDDPEGQITVFNLKGEVVLCQLVSKVRMRNRRILVNSLKDGMYIFVWYLNRQTKTQLIEITM